MKLYFMKRDALDFMKHNMERLYTHYYHDRDNEWMAEEYGKDPFELFMEVPDFELADIENTSIGEANFENCKILYNNLRNLSESQCSDERLWAGLCNGTFYDYMRRRYGYPSMQLKTKEKDASAIISRFFFSGGTRAGFFRNGLAKCWWVGRATFDKDNENHFERLDIIGPNDLTTKISDIFYSNTFSSNPTILAGICDALKFFKDHNQTLDEKLHIRAAMQYLNAVGGATLLDILSREEICRIVQLRITSIMMGTTNDIVFEKDVDEEETLLEEVLEEETEANTNTTQNLQDSPYNIAEEILEDEIEEISDEGDENNIENDTIEGESSSVNTEKKKSLYINVSGRSIVTPHVKKEEVEAKIEPLNWFNEEDDKDELLPAPQYITYGCWVKVINEKSHQIKKYHLPLKSDKSREWYLIEKKMMGQDVGFKIFLAGANQRVLEYGWDEANINTAVEVLDAIDEEPQILKEKVESDRTAMVKKTALGNSNVINWKDKTKKPVTEKASHVVAEENKEGFRKWLQKDGFFDRVIEKYFSIVSANEKTLGINLFAITDNDELVDFIVNRNQKGTTQEKAVYKYYIKYWNSKGKK